MTETTTPKLDARTFPITVRRATESDQAPLARLAALDSATVPGGPVLIAETDGELVAALSLRDGQTIADPFRPTAPIVRLLLAFAPQGQDGPKLPGQRWRRWRTGKVSAAVAHSRASEALA